MLIPALAMAIPGCDSPQDKAARAQDSVFQDAHFTAERFIKREYPGAKSISGYRDSVFEQEGDVYRVAVNVDGLNAFGGPIRKSVAVEMRLDGSKWTLIRIVQR